jgi:uncharacterized protein
MKPLHPIAMPALLACLCVAGPLHAAEPELRGTPADLQRYLKPPMRTVTLQGHAKLEVQSDVGHVSLVVHATGKDMASALRANTSRRDALVAALVRSGIDPKAIQPEKFSSSPQFGWFGKTPSAYEVTNRLTVDVVDDRQMQAVADAVGNGQEIGYEGAEFEYTHEEEAREALRHQAFDDALARRKFYEERLGATLRPVAFRFNNSTRTQDPDMALEEVVVTGERRGRAKLDVPPPVPAVPAFDKRTYEVVAELTFEVAPRP